MRAGDVAERKTIAMIARPNAAATRPRQLSDRDRAAPREDQGERPIASATRAGPIVGAFNPRSRHADRGRRRARRPRRRAGSAGSVQVGALEGAAPLGLASVDFRRISRPQCSELYDPETPGTSVAPGRRP